MSGWGNNLCWRFQNSLISLSFMLHIHIFEDHLKVGISWNIVWGGVKFSVKLDPISTDIVAHCITLHIIAGTEERMRGAIAPLPPDFSRFFNPISTMGDQLCPPDDCLSSPRIFRTSYGPAPHWTTRRRWVPKWHLENTYLVALP